MTLTAQTTYVILDMSTEAAGYLLMNSNSEAKLPNLDVRKKLSSATTQSVENVRGTVPVALRHLDDQ